MALTPCSSVTFRSSNETKPRGSRGLVIESMMRRSSFPRTSSELTPMFLSERMTCSVARASSGDACSRVGASTVTMNSRRLSTFCCVSATLLSMIWLMSRRKRLPA